MTKVSKDKLEKYFMVLSLLEDNMKRYKELKGELGPIVTETKELNANINEDDEDEDEDLDFEDEDMDGETNASIEVCLKFTASLDVFVDIGLWGSSLSDAPPLTLCIN